ncbi:hypothetical protein PIB30_023944 [Stylosanthes scabra]|uniref:Uncharacterized protein n=1 Tax=Stylosanthes scabra TaxID=79078 RepID=A0ABU6W847_9FABA|nr:hypothetical protein [Stylosanthes scabra]
MLGRGSLWLCCVVPRLIYAWVWRFVGLFDESHAQTTPMLTSFALLAMPRVELFRVFVLPEGDWNFILMGIRLPDDIIHKIRRVFPPSDEEGSDRPYWKHTSNGEFLTKSAYAIVTGQI